MHYKVTLYLSDTVRIHRFGKDKDALITGLIHRFENKNWKKIKVTEYDREHGNAQGDYEIFNS